MEDQGSSNEAAVLMTETSRLAQVRGRHQVADFEDPGDLASITAIHDLYHSEYSAFEGIEAKDGEGMQ